MGERPADTMIWLKPDCPVQEPAAGHERIEFRLRRAFYSGTLHIERTRDGAGALEIKAAGEVTLAFLKKWTYGIFVAKSARDGNSFLQFEGPVAARPSREWLITERGLECRRPNETAIEPTQIALAAERLRLLPEPICAAELIFLINDVLRRGWHGPVTYGAWFPLGDRLVAICLERLDGNELSGTFVRLPQPSESTLYAECNYLASIRWEDGTEFALTWDNERSAVSSIRASVPPYGKLELNLIRLERS